MFHSSCCYRRVNGKIFYFHPGHETHPVYHNDEIQRMFANGVEWASPGEFPDEPPLRNAEPKETLDADGSSRGSLRGSLGYVWFQTHR